MEDATEPAHRELARRCTPPRPPSCSGYDSPLYRELYGDWHRLDLPMAKPSANHSGDRDRAVEVLWSNRPLPAGEPAPGRAGRQLPISFPDAVIPDP